MMDTANFKIEFRVLENFYIEVNDLIEGLVHDF